jgi:hypothetical protein
VIAGPRCDNGRLHFAPTSDKTSAARLFKKGHANRAPQDDRATHGRGKSVTVWRAAATTVLLFAMYFALAGTISASEVLASAIAVAIAGTAAWAHLRVSPRMLLKAPWLRMAASVARALASDSAQVGKRLLTALWKSPVGPAGLVAEQPFEAGVSSDPAERGRRALVTLAASIAPNRFVVRAAPDEQRLLMHELRHVHSSADRRWPL